ncbi:MAG: HD-GYP domain-containing protein [Bacillota bacterium]|nr:HD-GYP domain-containing protein [Bacillota bacterium]
MNESYSEARESIEDVVIFLARTIDAKDKYTEGHIERVSQYAVFLGERIGLSTEELETLRVGAMVHDIGKIVVDLNILNKPGKLTDAEFEEIKLHPLVGEEICRPLKSLEEVIKIVRYHHEKLDGSGYPDGITGDDIPIEVRIVTIVDIFDALTTDRSYRKAMKMDDAIRILREDAVAGKLDHGLVEEFIDMLSDLHGYGV